MKRKFRCGVAAAFFSAAAFVMCGCSIFPKEEELVKTPIIEAYQQEEFKMAEAKRGTLKHYETMEAVVQSKDEKELSFPFDNMWYEGIYVKTGDTVKKDQPLAKLNPARHQDQVGDSSQLELHAPYDGVVVYARELEDGERSVAGQVILILNPDDNFVLSVYTPYWDKFEAGGSYILNFAGGEYEMTVINETDLGLEPIVRPENPEESSRVYFTVHAPGLLMHSGQVGTVTILVEEKEDALYIPSTAINVINDEEIVYVENADGIRSTRKVKTGMWANENVEILEGLSEGDKVIMD